MGGYLRQSQRSSPSPSRGSTLCKTLRPAAAPHPIERDLVAWHERVLGHLRGGEPGAALPVLARLALALPWHHEARPGVLAVLAHVYCELGRFERALPAAVEALRLDPTLRMAEATVRRAQGGLGADD